MHRDSIVLVGTFLAVLLIAARSVFVGAMVSVLGCDAGEGVSSGWFAAWSFICCRMRRICFSDMPVCAAISFTSRPSASIRLTVSLRSVCMDMSAWTLAVVLMDFLGDMSADMSAFSGCYVRGQKKTT